MPELRRSRAPDIRYIVGATGSGKTWYVQRLIRAHRARCLVFDFKDDHHQLPTVRGLADLARRVLAEPVLRYVPSSYDDLERQFDLFCRIAWTVQAAQPDVDCLLVVEELAELTKPSSAPQWWRRINVQGRVYGFIVVGTTQRPQFVDKSFTSSATFIRCGRLGELPDARVIGQRIGVDPGELQRLPDRAAYVFDGRNVRLEGAGKRRAPRTMDATI